MMMKEKVGEVFFIAMDNPAIPGCTISKAVHDGANDIICFSLSRNTDISAEIYPYHKLIIMAEGVIEIYGEPPYQRQHYNPNGYTDGNTNSGRCCLYRSFDQEERYHERGNQGG